MPTPVWLTGFEHGVVNINGGGLFDQVSGSPSAVTTAVRTGTYALEIAAAGAATMAAKTIGVNNIFVVTFYIRFIGSLPGADVELFTITASAGGALEFNYVNASTKFGMRYNAGTQQVSTNTIAADTWYRVDLRADFNSNPRTIDWQIDGVAETQASKAVAGSTGNQVRFGTTAAQTYTAHYDDVIVSVTSGDYPIGQNAVFKLSPDADGTHSPSTPDCIRGGGASPALISGSNTAFQYMDDVPLPSGASPTTDRINQDTVHATHYVEMLSENIGSFTYLGVSGILAYGGDSGTTNRGATILVRTDATEISVFGTPAAPADMSETSVFYKFAIVTPPGGGWTQAEINGLLWRIGYSSDVTPNPYWQGLMIEVATAPAVVSTRIKDPIMSAGMTPKKR